LLNRYTIKSRIEGSNPSGSARSIFGRGRERKEIHSDPISSTVLEGTLCRRGSKGSDR
jgi:hypothetical protein